MHVRQRVASAVRGLGPQPEESNARGSVEEALTQGLAARNTAIAQSRASPVGVGRCQATTAGALYCATVEASGISDSRGRVFGGGSVSGGSGDSGDSGGSGDSGNSGKHGEAAAAYLAEDIVVAEPSSTAPPAAFLAPPAAALATSAPPQPPLLFQPPLPPPLPVAPPCRKLQLGAGRRATFLANLRSDVGWLREHGIVDYSLLLGVSAHQKAHTCAHACMRLPLK
jgi:hypothetical protein